MKYLVLTFFIVFFKISTTQKDVLQESIDFLLQGNKDELVNIEDATEQLRTILHQPLDINISSAQQLSQLPLISPQQAEEIVKYREQNGNIISIYELKHINLSPTLLELLIYYFKSKVSTQEQNTNLIYILRAQSKFTQEENHLGNPTKIYSRLKYSSGNIQLGFTTEKDQGEPFLNTKEPYGFDFYSGYFQYNKNNLSVIVGDYSINTAQGLVLSNAFRSIYNNSPLYANLYQHQIKAYTSTNENSFFRGVCVKRNFKKIEFQPFISFKKIDASIENDTIKSFQNTGYHRTITELNRKDVCTELSFGNSLAYTYKHLTLGFTQSFLKYNLPFVSDSNYYKIKTSISRWQNNNSFDWTWRLRNINFFGEIAANNKLSSSFIGGIVASLNKTITLSARIRRFSNNLYNPYAYTYSQSSTPKNEKGIDFSILLNLRKNEQITINLDVYQHPQIRYGVKSPSYGKEFSILYQKMLNEKVSFYSRYQYRENAILFNKNEIKEQGKSHQFRTQINWRFTHTSTFSFRNEIHISNGKTGWLAYINIKHDIKNSPFDICVRYTLFNVQDYDARIYAYENDVMYSSSIPSFSTIGNQLYGMLKYRLNAHYNFWLKYSAQELKIQMVFQK